MKKKKESFTYCFGTGCPRKEMCVRFREKIDKKREDFFGITPYIKERDYCGHFIERVKDEEGGNSAN